MPAIRYRLCHRVFSLAAVVVLGSNSIPDTAFAQNSSGDRITLDGRAPLRRAIQQIEERCRCVVTYESAIWSSDESIDIGDAVRRSPGNSPVLVPREGTGVVFTLPGLGAKREEVIHSLAGAIQSYNNSGAPRRFRLDSSDAVLHVTAEDGSILDALVTLEPKERSVSETIDAVLNLLSREWNLPIRQLPGIFQFSWAYLMDSPVTFSATREPAVRTLTRLLAGTGRKISYELNYETASHAYYLTFHFVDPDDAANAVYRNSGRRPELRNERFMLTDPPGAPIRSSDAPSELPVP